MINFVLNDLRGPACEILGMRFHFKSFELHLDGLISFALMGAAEKRQTTFLGVVRAVLLDDLGVEHHGVC